MATAAQVEQELKDWNDGEYYHVANAVFDGLHTWRSDAEKKSFEIPSGVVTLEENVGGGEGDGEERYIVIKVGEQFFQFNGFYSSWDGTEWYGDLVEVEPYQVSVTQYREVK